MNSQIMLAPMDGVLDHTMRDLLSSLGGIDRCVTEFARVTQTPLNNKRLNTIYPEIHRGGHTAGGIPVYLQLLGSDPQLMAQSAALAADRGAAGIDINFGCPAKSVCNHRGGSILLEEPALVEQIVARTRQAVDDAVPVTVKIRLGFNDSDNFNDNIQAIINGGANELCIHARTRKQAYQPPAHWHMINAGDWPINIIANGEVWNYQDYLQCRKQTGSRDIMLGRGVIACPDLPMMIKAQRLGLDYQPMQWQQILPLLIRLQQINIEAYPSKHAGNRTKQWLMYMQEQYSEAAATFEAVKRMNDSAEILRLLQQQLN
ncbi:tRNA-dihydrouridine(16) synthase [Sinobacterium norvegicum]|uniref:tRNA-dihydrouridine(16) synthase n=1 Tax=Sinobacterium norvegicum TaxID=1641715 RepID=A0ABN8EL76_9GAMM|nr:tRNA-dihydrouridine synthase family protein [Sinobacterium norvegicum]CAH0992485.1 tRNA-dihydrouridine(16) synthase [Sinobacterium norvegicum]